MRNGMTPQQKFKSAIKRGTGETHLLLKNNPKIDFSKDIRKAALTSLAYDSQSEGSRANYIFELIELSSKKEILRKAILKALATEREDTWTLDQLFKLAALFAKQGDMEARKAIYKRYKKKKIKYSEWLGEEEILKLDRQEGLFFLAKAKGKAFLKQKEAWEDSRLLDLYHELQLKSNGFKELKKASQTNRSIKAYVDAVQHHKSNFVKQERPIFNYATVSKRIEKKAIDPMPPRFANELSEKDIQKLADDFRNEKDRLKLEKYLRVFSKVKYPYNYQDLLVQAKRKRNSNDRLVEFASAALKFYTAKDIRAFALKKITTVKWPFDYLDLLIANYQKGDHKLLTQLVSNCKNKFTIHEFAEAYIRIYQSNKTKACKGPLEAIYSKLTCSLHRQYLVEILIENKVLSKQLKKELQHDCNEEIRKLII